MWRLASTLPAMQYVAIGVAVSLVAALWYTTSRLSAAREDLAEARAGIALCITANATAVETIAKLEAAQDLNRAARQSALKAQATAIGKARELQDRIDNADTVTQIIQHADGDACAHVDIPIRLRDAASRNAVRDSSG